MKNEITVKEEGAYLGMGVRGTIFRMFFNNKLICCSDFEPEFIDEINMLLKMSERFDAKPVLVINRTNSHYNPEVYACYCGKQQKDTFKNRRDGCFCERCGQKLVWEGKK